ncbi:MAG: site-specific integrase [Ktedonobacteraceae bacterium]
MNMRANGEGSVYQRKDGRWTAAISLENGQRKYLYRHTQAEAVKALQLVQQARMQGTLFSTRDETVETFLQNWFQYRLRPQVREKTAQRYQEVITNHLFPTLGKIKLQKLTVMHIQELYDVKLQQHSPRTIHFIHKVLRRALEDAVQLHHHWYNVCQKVVLPRLPRGQFVIKTLSIQQARQFLKAAEGDPLEALYVLALTTGMRQGELLALIWDDLDFTTSKLQVRRSLSRSSERGNVVSELKTVSSRRCIYLAPLALDTLKRHRQQQKKMQQEAGADWAGEKWVFCNSQGKPLHASNLIRRSFRPLLERAGLPVMRFHDLRHSTAALLLSIGTHPKIVQELLGHSQIIVTLEIYSHILPPLQEDAVKQLNAFLTDSNGC